MFLRIPDSEDLPNGAAVTFTGNHLPMVGASNMASMCRVSSLSIYQWKMQCILRTN